MPMYIGGTAPGFMLLAAEYSLGMCLSWLQRLQNVEPAVAMVKSGKHSTHVQQ